MNKFLCIVLLMFLAACGEKNPNDFSFEKMYTILHMPSGDVAAPGWLIISAICAVLALIGAIGGSKYNSDD
jgi:hypothetical protein